MLLFLLFFDQAFHLTLNFTYFCESRWCPRMTPQPPVAHAMRAHPSRSSEAGGSQQLCPRAVGSGTTFLRAERGAWGGRFPDARPKARCCWAKQRCGSRQHWDETGLVWWLQKLELLKKSLGSWCLPERRKHLMFSFIRLGQQIIWFILICPEVLRQSPHWAQPRCLAVTLLLLEMSLNFCLILFVGWRAATAADITDLGSATEKLSLSVWEGSRCISFIKERNDSKVGNAFK